MEILKDIIVVVTIISMGIIFVIGAVGIVGAVMQEIKWKREDDESAKYRQQMRLTAQKEEEDEKERVKNPSTAEWIERERLVDATVKSRRKDDDFLRKYDLKETATSLSDFIEEFYEGKDDFVKEKLCITSRELIKIKIASVESFDSAVLKRFYHVLAKCTDLPKEYNKLF